MASLAGTFVTKAYDKKGTGMADKKPTPNGKKPPKKNFMGMTKKEYFDYLAKKQKPKPGKGLTLKPMPKKPQKTAAQVQEEKGSMYGRNRSATKKVGKK